MAQFDVDLFTIGGGSGGVRASRLAAGHGAKVAIAEARWFGGTCVNAGCIPKKLLSYAAHFRDDFRDALAHGWRFDEPRFDWATLVAGKDREVARLESLYERLLRDAGVETLRGHARVLGPHEVAIGGRRIRARHILIATGSLAKKPDIPGAELGLTSTEMFFLDRLPSRALIVGGGYIAVEFASILCGLGVDTQLAHRGARLLRGFDPELGERLADEMRGKGVQVRLRAAPARLTAAPHGRIVCEFAGGATLDTDLVLFATGRVPNSDGLGLEAAGVALGPQGQVQVDRYGASSVPSIHAIGDVTHRLNLTPVATAEGMALARTLFAGVPTPFDHDHVPTAVFSNPNVATVGLGEDAARERFGEIDIYKTNFRSLRHALSGAAERVFMKLVVERAGQKVVGAHMIGPDAGEIIQGIAIAVKLGATKAQFDATLGIHPTVAEEFVTLREKAACPLPPGQTSS